MARIDKGHGDTHPKSWGSEIWVENTEDFCGKFLCFEKAGTGTSLHFHAKKTETMFVYSGCLLVELTDPETGELYSLELWPGEKVFIPLYQAHRLTATRDATNVIEFSSHHEDSDSYRVGPRYV